MLRQLACIALITPLEAEGTAKYLPDEERGGCQLVFGTDPSIENGIAATEVDIDVCITYTLINGLKLPF